MAQLQASTVAGILTTTGNVGIGTSNPTAKLDIRSNGLDTNPLSIYGTTSGAKMFDFRDDSASGVTAAMFRMYNASGTETVRLFPGTVTAHHSWILPTGNMGIGTTSPGVKLDVNGSGRFSGGLVYLGNYSGNPEIIFQATSNSYSKINFYDNNNTEGLYIRTDGEVYGGTMTFGARWDDDEAKIVFKMYQTSAGASYDQRVGIGTDSPEATLHVGRNSAGNNTDYQIKLQRHGTSASPGTWSDVPAIQINDFSGDGPSSIPDFGLLDIRTGRVADADTNSNNAHLIRVANDNGTALVVTGKRQVGIGTNNPIYPLVISNRGPSTGERQLAIGNTATGGTFLFLGTSATTSGYGVIQNISVEGTSFGNLALQPGGGDVGIGTTSPGIGDGSYVAPLTINSTSTLGTFLAIKNTQAQYGMGGVWMQANTGNAGWLFGTDNDGKGVLHYGSGASETAALTDAKDGTKGITIDTAGNVGIGTATPQQILHTYKAGDWQLRLQNPDAGGGYWNIGQSDNNFNTGGGKLLFVPDSSASNNATVVFTNSGNVGIGTASPTAKLQVQGSTRIAGDLVLSGGSRYITGDGGDLFIDTENVAGRDILLQTVSGQKVGIGLTTPRAKLEVSGDIYQSWADAERFIGQVYVDGNSYRNGILTNSATRTTQIEARSAGADGEITFLVGTDEVARMIHGGNVGIGTNTPLRRLDVREGNVQIVANFQNTSSTSARIKFTDANTGAENVNIGAVGTRLALYTNNTERLSIPSGGNVGIGTTNPAAKLHVSGTLRVDNAGSAPTLSDGNAITNYYGTDQRYYLAEPRGWLAINVDGSAYVIPLY